LEKVLNEMKQLQATFKQHELEMSKDKENSNRKLEALQQELDAAVALHSVELAGLQATMDIKQAELQANIERSVQTDVANKAIIKQLQSRIEMLETEVREKDRKITDLSKMVGYARFGSEDSINVVVPETESQTGTSGNGQPKKISVARLQPLILNLPRHDSLDDDFGFVSSIAMQDDDDTDFDMIDDRSTINGPILKRMRSSYPPMVRERQ
jgi:hypothetical protein